MTSLYKSEIYRQGAKWFSFHLSNDLINFSSIVVFGYNIEIYRQSCAFPKTLGSPFVKTKIDRNPIAFEVNWNTLPNNDMIALRVFPYIVILIE